MTRIVPITVLVWEGPQARAYLVRMRRSGIRPQRIIVMVSDPLAQAPGHLSAILQLGERRQDKKNNHHAYAIRNAHPQLVRAIATAMDPIIPDASGFIAEMFEGFSYANYADRVDRVAASSYADSSLHESLAVELIDGGGAGTVLFTGGGLVPKAVFAIPGISIVHVHTGLLPYVRGADVLLWSLMVRGRPGISAFIMTPGLDDGDVLATRECEPIAIPIARSQRPDDDTLYRALFCFIDPLLRADLLVHDVLENRDVATLTTGIPQDLTTGVTFHFMHATVRSRALHELFPTERLEAATASHAESVASTTKYNRYYDKVSILAPLRFYADSLRTKNALRVRGLRNRQADYSRLIGHPELMPVHKQINALLARQHAEWSTYDYGEGYHYQSSDELGITGLRDTTGRVEAFDLRRRLAGKTVLEIGCNTGFIALAVASSAARVVGFELNPLLIDIAKVGATHLNAGNVEFLVSSFEEFESQEQFDVVLSFANHHTYDGNTHQSLEDYFARCHRYTAPGGTLLFESHPPALEGAAFAKTLAIIERFYEITESEIHSYGTFLDGDRRFVVGQRRATVAS